MYVLKKSESLTSNIVLYNMYALKLSVTKSMYMSAMFNSG